MSAMISYYLAFITFLGLICYVIYHLFEPRKVPVHLLLLVVVPLLTTGFLRPFFTSTTIAALAAWSLYIGTVLLSTFVYRLSPFHPLAQYPGPIPCRITKMWLAKISLSGKQHLYLRDLHTRYGDVVRTGPNELSFCTPDAIPPMLGLGGMPKAEYWDSQFVDQKTYRSLVGIRQPQQHGQLRRRWAKAFTPDALKSYTPILDQRVTQLVECIAQREGRSLNLAQWIGWFSYDVMNDFVFGSGTELMLNEDPDGVRKLMEDSQPAANFMSHIPWSAEFSLWIPTVAKKLKEFRQYSYDRVSKRYKQGSPTKDLFYYLMDEGNAEVEQLSFEQIATDSSLAIVAGSDTISTTLSNIFYFLLRNPITYSRLQAEIDTTQPSIGNVSGQSNLPYLNAVINESLRLIPPVPSGSIRAPLIGGRGHRIGSHFLPEGTTAIVHPYTLQRDERNFSPAPESFLPERWLPRDEQVQLEADLFRDHEKVVHNTSGFIPFSYGPANCVGKQLALQEIRMTVCAILQHFDLRFANDYDPSRWEEDLCDYFVVNKGQLNVVFTPRA